jgi:hypothetical protein
MYHKWLSATLLLLITLLSGAGAVAQTLDAEQTKLAELEQQLQDLQSRQQQWQTELAAKQAELEPLLGQTSPEAAELDIAQKNLDAATAAYQADPSSDNKAKLKNTEFKYALAERSFKKANSQQFSLKEEIQQISTELASASEQTASISEKIHQQRQLVDNVTVQQRAAEEARQEQERKLKAEAAAAEIARLKAQLAAQKKAEQKAREDAALAAQAAAKSALSSAAASPTTSTAATTATPEAAPAKVESTPIIAPTTAPVTTNPVPVTTNPVPATTNPATATETDSNNSGAILFTTREQVQSETQRIKALLATPDTGKGTRYNKILNIKPLNSDGETGRTEANTLHALGHYQYRGKAKLNPGEAIFIVGFNRWRQQLPNAPLGTEYIFIYDASDNKNPRLVYYSSSLEI